jgi:hypothetical protein
MKRVEMRLAMTLISYIVYRIMLTYVSQVVTGSHLILRPYIICLYWLDGIVVFRMHR